MWYHKPYVKFMGDLANEEYYKNICYGVGGAILPISG